MTKLTKQEVEATNISTKKQSKKSQNYHKGVCKSLNWKHIAGVTVLGEAKSEPSGILHCDFLCLFLFCLFIAIICGNLYFLARVEVQQMKTLAYQILAF